MRQFLNTSAFAMYGTDGPGHSPATLSPPSQQILLSLYLTGCRARSHEPSAIGPCDRRAPHGRAHTPAHDPSQGSPSPPNPLPSGWPVPRRCHRDIKHTPRLREVPPAPSARVSFHGRAPAGHLNRRPPAPTPNDGRGQLTCFAGSRDPLCDAYIVLAVCLRLPTAPQGWIVGVQCASVRKLGRFATSLGLRLRAVL